MDRSTVSIKSAHILFLSHLLQQQQPVKFQHSLGQGQAPFSNRKI